MLATTAQAKILIKNSSIAAAELERLAARKLQSELEVYTEWVFQTALSELQDGVALHPALVGGFTITLEIMAINDVLQFYVIAEDEVFCSYSMLEAMEAFFNAALHAIGE